MDDAIANADVVSIHCPLTQDTRSIISTQQFDLMKPSAMLINTARGGIVDEQALVTALKTGKIAGAGLDCYESEPLSADNDLLGLSNAILTPHIGWATREVTARMGQISVRNVVSILNGAPPDMDCLINPAVLS